MPGSDRRREGSTSPAAVAAGVEWEPRRSFFESHPWLVDWAVAGIYTVSLVLSRVYGLMLGDPNSTVWHIVVAVLTGAALLFRRYRPLGILVAVAILTTVVTWSLDANNDILAVPIALYSVAAFRKPRTAWLSGIGALALAAAGLAVWFPLQAAGGEYDYSNLLLIFALLSLIAILFGSLTYARRDRLRGLEQRAEQLVRERDSQATIATLAERSRIAREMHDIVAHSVSIMVALSDGAIAAVDRDPTVTKQALQQLSETGRSALADMRSVLSVLPETSAPDDQRRPAPGSRDLPDLIDRFRAADLPIRFTVSGVAPDDPALELTAYRIVQESLTNVLRYAVNATSVDVTIVHSDDTTTVSVIDNGHHRDAGLAEKHGSGRGIIGMTERAVMLGGHVETGARPLGGWEVLATLPHPGTHHDVQQGERHD
ncbi:sensor histidine kinase [Homoserinimonas sp. A447]